MFFKSNFHIQDTLKVILHALSSYVGSLDSVKKILYHKSDSGVDLHSCGIPSYAHQDSYYRFFSLTNCTFTSSSGRFLVIFPHII